MEDFKINPKKIYISLSVGVAVATALMSFSGASFYFISRLEGFEKQFAILQDVEKDRYVALKDEISTLRQEVSTFHQALYKKLALAPTNEKQLISSIINLWPQH